MIWQDVVGETERRLGDAGVSEAGVSAEYMAAHVLGVWKKSDVRAHFMKEITEAESLQLEKMILRRLDHEPLQHILGETEFYGLRLFCSPAALIPRPDTEVLVEEALRFVKTFSRSDIQILDVGTGSGAIALAIAANLPQSNVLGIDVSEAALELAEENKERLGLSNVRFDHQDIFDKNIEEAFSSRFDVIISNPPYISQIEFGTLDCEVREFDPRIALTDEGDGYRFYRRISELGTLLREQGAMLLEVGYDGAKEVERIFGAAGFHHLSTVKDIQGIERVVAVRKVSV